MRFETIAVHAGHEPDPTTGAIAPPIHLSTTFAREPDLSYRAGFVYSRYANPNRQSLERCLATLEGGGAAASFSSGSAATSAVLQSLAADSHLILPDDVYYGTLKLARDIFAPSRLRLSCVDMTDIAAVERAITKETRVVWAESPSNPLVRVVDIARIAQLARAAGAWVVVDNTWATPMLQQPLRLGADIVMHSTTKYLGGHSDILGGALVASSEQHPLFAKCRAVQAYGGAVPSPFDCWLTLRGIRTLELRMQRHAENADAIARALASHPLVWRVYYPGLPSHPGHEIAARQMSGFGGMVSFELDGTIEEVVNFVSSRRYFALGESLGGVKALVCHPARMTHASIPPDARAALGLSDTLVRLSPGCEHPRDLVSDLIEGLNAIEPARAAQEVIA
jgi:cystathionine beta-lyase/cystathionine gamma-synthase